MTLGTAPRHVYGRFEVLRQLGAGGMGIVYEALDTACGERVALKTLRRFTPEALALFKREFQLLHDLHHPHLVSLGELLGMDEQWAFTMELVEGERFHDFVRFERAQPIPESPTMDLRGGGPPAASPSAALTGGARFDEARLRQCLRQIADALLALHDFGRVHRDIKPSNLLVAHGGRVVVLDFGLVQEAQRWCDDSPTDQRGTVDYMAPEQAAGQAVGSEADWYAVGVLLYEVLTGAPPFRGAPSEVLERKQRLEAEPPSAHAPGAPRDLCDLAASLLRLDPSARAGGFDVLHVCGAPVGAPRSRSSSFASSESTFVGRVSELGALRSAFEDTRRDRLVVVLLEGESGIGKTALERRFCAELAREVPGLLVLRGRCHAQESVPFKAFDGIVDDLSASLRQLSGTAAAALVPRRASLIVQAFPVLGRVPAFAESPQASAVIDPQERRQRVFAAFRELLGRLAETRPVIATIDDLQWADEDSFAMLRELVRSPDSPPILLLATVRTDDVALPEGLTSLATDVRRLAIGGLPPEDAARLCALVRGGEHGIDAAVVAREALGHPLFVRELARHPAGEHPVRLEDALWTRIADLEPEVRRLLEVIAVAGRPVAAEVAISAALRDAGAQRPDSIKRLVALRAESLVRSIGMGRAARLEPYHDRVRRAVVEHLSPEARSAIHRGLAVALEGTGDAEAESLALHWRGAGEPGRAFAYALRAAEESAQALAFDRSARLYRMALELDAAAAERGGLLARLGTVLSMGGRGPEAAGALLAAASAASAADAVDLRRRAGEQLLRSGHIDEGLATLRTVLEAAGLRYPSTPVRALVSLGLQRARMRLRGTRFSPRDPGEIAPAELARLDLCWAVALNLAFVDPIRSADFHCRYLLRALRCGEPARIARGFMIEAGYLAAQGPAVAPRARALLDRAAALLVGPERPQLLAELDSVRGLVAYLAGDFSGSIEIFARCERIFRERCVGVAFELDSTVYLRMCALYFTGRLGELVRQVPELHAEATERGDQYAAANLCIGPPSVIWLVRDDPTGARRAADEAMAAWSRSGGHLQHFNHMLAIVHALLYERRGQEALALVQASWRTLSRAQLLRIAIVRTWMHDLRARAALAVGTSAALAQAGHDARALSRQPGAMARGLGALVTALVCARTGERLRAVAHLEAAASMFEAEHLELLAWAAERRLAELVTGDRATALERRSDDYVQAHAIVQPGRLCAVFAP